MIESNIYCFGIFLYDKHCKILCSNAKGMQPEKECMLSDTQRIYDDDMLFYNKYYGTILHNLLGTIKLNLFFL